MSTPIVTVHKGSPKFSQSRNGHKITADYDIYVFNPLEARLYLPQYGDTYVDDDGFTDAAKVTSVECEPVSADRTDPHCTATVEWEYSHDTSGGGRSGEDDGWTIETTPATTHITHVDAPAKQLTYDGANPAGHQAGTAIGQSGDPTEDPTGLDVQAPYSTVRVWKYYEADEVTDAFVKQLEKLRPTVNNAVYRIGPRWFQLGELLYIAFDLSNSSSSSKKRIEFTFLMRPNEIGLKFTVSMNNPLGIGDPVEKQVTVNALGWQYVEKAEGLVTRTSAVATNNIVYKRLVAVKVSDVYEYKNFALLRATVDA